MPHPFLTARWSNLFLATFAVPPPLLEKRLPPGLQLDFRDDRTFVSLVAFDFLNTRVLGISLPGHRNFAELNLRFYVRAGADRGVVFVREFVPRRLIAWLARTIYNEPYIATPLASTVREDGSVISIEHRLDYAGRTHTIRAAGRKPAFRPSEISTEHFLKEHRWGFGTTRRGVPLRYEVIHAVWDVYAVESYEIDLNWEAVYGSEWAFLKDAVPYSTVLAVGSPIAVYPKGKL